MINVMPKVVWVAVNNDVAPAKCGFLGGFYFCIRRHEYKEETKNDGKGPTKPYVQAMSRAIVHKAAFKHKVF